MARNYVDDNWFLDMMHLVDIELKFDSIWQRIQYTRDDIHQYIDGYTPCNII